MREAGCGERNERVNRLTNPETRSPACRFALELPVKRQTIAQDAGRDAASGLRLSAALMRYEQPVRAPEGDL